MVYTEETQRFLRLQHWLNVIGYLEGSFCFGADLLNGNTISQLDQSKAVGKVNIKDAEFGDDSADTSSASEWELALLENLGVALLIGMFHGDDDFSSSRVGDEIHGSSKALDLTWKHPYLKC